MPDEQIYELATKVDDGGPAFPRQDLYGHDGCAIAQGFTGMSLRDYFAAKAMQAQIARYGDGSIERIAVDSYTIADAMLAARGAK